MAEPIEITEKDLISRPVTGSEPAKDGGMNPLTMLKTFKQSMGELKEIIETARGMGLNINLPGLGGLGAERHEQKDDARALPPPNPAQQFNAFLALVQMQFGDITMNELIDKLKAEFGDKKISQLRRK